MDDNRKAILSHSTKVITRLQLLSVFFQDDIIYNIFIRTQVIQKLFETNPELDINKLELFHLQYTETVIELLRKIKKSNENTVSITQDEIAYNEDLAEKLKHTLLATGNYSQEVQAHTTAINTALNRLYNNLSGYSPEPPFPSTITNFSEKNSYEYFQEITPLLFDELIAFDAEEVYKNGYGIIEKKLLGWQCKYAFKNTFIGGLKAGERYLEIYKLQQKDTYFIFYPARHLLVDLDFKKIADIDFTSSLSKPEKLVNDIQQKTVKLKNSLETIKTNIPISVDDLLQEYYSKITALDFTNDEFDIQANILKTMLNTKGL